MTDTPDITIPADLLPSDGRFCSGPSLVRPDSVAALVEAAPTYLGTSHRYPAVKNVVGELREGLAQLFSLPDGYEVVIGNGGATTFWDCATFGLIENKSQHLVCGEFSSKFAKAAAAAPHLGEPQVIESATGTHPVPVAADDVDAYALIHNETSTGVQLPLDRPAAEGLVLVDATSGAGGIRFDVSQTDAYYFAPQKCFGSDGGLWFALMSPAAMERVRSISASGRWVPAALDLELAIDNSVKNQTYNTPALTTIFLMLKQVEWMNNGGGLDFAAGRSDRSAEILYGWAEASAYASPFVENPAERSPVVGTIDIDDRADALAISAILRANGITDTESYRKLGRNQLRIAMFPAIEPDDVAQLTRCIDHIVAELTA